MAGVFPESGVSAGQATNTIANPSVVAGCTSLWHSTSRCTPRFDPAAANAVTAEIINLVNCAGLPYDCNRLDNLCTAVKDLINDTLTSCLTINFPVADDACSIEQLVQITDASGCRRIARYSEAASQISSARDNSVWGNSFQGVRPQNPNDPNTFYNYGELGLDVAAGAVDESKLTDNHLVTITFTLPCATNVRIQGISDVVFDPQTNAGNGADSQIVVRVDGVFPISAANQPFTLGGFTNFDSEFRGELVMNLAAGSHTIQTYIVASGSGRPPAQVFVTGSPITGSNFIILFTALS